MTSETSTTSMKPITMKKAPENRINMKFAQELIQALRLVEEKLGKDAEGAVIIKGEKDLACLFFEYITDLAFLGNDAKFWCTV